MKIDKKLEKALSEHFQEHDSSTLFEYEGTEYIADQNELYHRFYDELGTFVCDCKEKDAPMCKNMSVDEFTRHAHDFFQDNVEKYIVEIDDDENYGNFYIIPEQTWSDLIVDASI